MQSRKYKALLKSFSQCQRLFNGVISNQPTAAGNLRLLPQSRERSLARLLAELEAVEAAIRKRPRRQGITPGFPTVHFNLP
jgi:hypothetical protein